MLSLKTRIITGLFLVALYGLTAIAIALTLPSSNMVFQQNDEQLVAHLPDSGKVTVVAFSNGQSTLPAPPTLRLEEPDVRPVDHVSNLCGRIVHRWMHNAVGVGAI